MHLALQFSNSFLMKILANYIASNIGLTTMLRAHLSKKNSVKRANRLTRSSASCLIDLIFGILFASRHKEQALQS